MYLKRETVNRAETGRGPGLALTYNYTYSRLLYICMNLYGIYELTTTLFKYHEHNNTFSNNIDSNNNNNNDYYYKFQQNE